ncbi:MAG TPA: hypothetical protein VNN76_03925 [Bacteroidota bacterium]|nr:hypothetical protein [Bacteroidota bacterium]
MTWFRPVALILTAIPLLLLQTCIDKGVDPQPPKDMRKLIWRVDTLYTPGAQTILTDVWGSSPQNVLAIGWMSGRSILYRFNGSNWSVEPLPPPDQPFNFVGLNAITGFAHNDIYVVGEEIGTRNNYRTDTSLILHFNGWIWRKLDFLKGRTLHSVTGSSSGNIWSGGWNLVLHWDGVEWKNVQVPLFPQGVRFLSAAALASNDIYMTGFRIDVVQPHDTTAYFLYRYDGTTWSITDSVIQTAASPDQKFGGLLKEIGGTLFSSGSGVFRKNGQQWVRLLDDPAIYFLGGTRPDNLFASGGRGKAYHYNGRDWYQLKELQNPDAELRRIWTDGNEVFIVGFIEGGLKGIAWHGK